MRPAMVASVVAALLLAGCYRGYKTAEELEKDDRGPEACEASCQELGMQMGAFVLVERGMSGCVCSPRDDTQDVQGGNAAVTAASYALLEAQRRADEEQQRQQQQQQQQFQPIQ